MIRVVVGMIALVILGLVAEPISVLRSEATGTPDVQSDVPVTAMDLGAGPSNNSPALAVDPTEARFVVIANRLDAPDFGCALQVSGDGGRGWLTASPVPALPAGVDKCYAPEVAFDRSGLLYYLFVGLEGRGNEPVGAFLTTSADRGQTFNTPVPVLGSRNFGVRMAIDSTLGDEGRLHLVWVHGSSDPPLGGFGPPPNPILSAYSDDGGRTFSEPVQVSDPDRSLVVAPALSLGPDHAVHVAYYDLQEDVRDYQGLEGPTWDRTWSVLVSSSRDGGRQFGSSSVVADAVVPSERVMLIFTMPPPALAASEKETCAAWTDARNGDPDALLRCSYDGGRSWQAVERLNDDRIGNGIRQYLPRLAVSPDGRLDAVFFDRRDDAQNVRNDVYYTYSDDGGRHFAPNMKLTHYSSSSRIGQQYVGPAAEGQYELGSRLGLLSSRDHAIAAWPDTRNSRPGTTSQDIFATDINGPPKDGWTPELRLVGLLLLAAAVTVPVGVMVYRRRARPSR